MIKSVIGYRLGPERVYQACRSLYVLTNPRSICQWRGYRNLIFSAWNPVVLDSETSVPSTLVLPHNSYTGYPTEIKHLPKTIRMLESSL